MTKQDLIKKAKEMIAAPSVYEGAKDAAQKWIDAVGTDGEKAAAETLIKELSDDVCTIDSYLTFTEKGAPAVFGADKAAEMHEAGVKAKAEGEKWCLCDACQAGSVILENKDVILD